MRPSSNPRPGRKPVAIATVAPISRTAHRSAPRRRRRLARAAQAVLALFRLWHSRARQRVELARLDARLLRDIGVTAAEVERECNKPFWRG